MRMEMFALPFRQMKMEIKTLLNTRLVALETLKIFVQLSMQQALEHKHPLLGRNSIDHRKNFLTVTKRTHAAIH